MRIDKYLKVARLIKRRSVANEACDQGRITVNGRIVKASYDVKAKRYYRNQDGRENYKSTGYGDSRTRFEK